MAAVQSAPPAGGQNIVTRTEIALTGVYEISKLLSAAVRLEHKLAGVLNLVVELSRHAPWPDRADARGWHARDGRGFRLVGGGSNALFRASAGARDRPDRRDQDAAGGRQREAGSLFADWQLPDGATTGAVCSFIGVPIKDRDQVIGTLTIDRVWDGQSHFRLDEDVRFLTMIANLIGQTVQLHEIVARDRERLMAEQRRLEKACRKPTPPSTRPTASPASSAAVP